MPLDRLVLIVVSVLAIGIALIWMVGLLLTARQFPAGWLALIPLLLVGYVVWRVVYDRISSSEDDHYDRIEK